MQEHVLPATRNGDAQISAYLGHRSGYREYVFQNALMNLKYLSSKMRK